MILRRTCAATAALLTALLLQATVVAPLTMPIAVSLPVVMVMSLALVAGAPAGLSVGFAIGLIADLGSHHPVGIFALTWMQVAICCAKVGPMLRSMPSRVFLAAFGAALATAAATLLLTMTGSAGATLQDAIADFVPIFVGDLLLAAIVLPVVSRVEGSDSLRGGSASASHDAGVEAAQRRTRAEIAGLAGQWR